MFKDPMSNIVTLVNGLECALMRQTFLTLQEDTNATPQQLETDKLSWDYYLETYCKTYRTYWKDTAIN